MTEIVAFLPLPSVAAAVIFTVFPFPAFKAFATPLEETVIYFVFEEVKVKVLFAPADAVTTAFNFVLFPAFIFDGAVTFSFFTIPFMEVILKEPCTLLPSLDKAVMATDFPPLFFFKVTTPLEEIVATLVLLDFHCRALLVALEGEIVAFKVSFFPAAILWERPDNRIFWFVRLWRFIFIDYHCILFEHGIIGRNRTS